MHAAMAFGLAKENPECNIYEAFSKDQYKEIRKICVDVILHTDMIMHFPMIKELQISLLQLGEDELDLIDPTEGPNDAEVYFSDKDFYSVHMVFVVHLRY